MRKTLQVLVLLTIFRRIVPTDIRLSEFLVVYPLGCNHCTCKALCNCSCVRQLDLDKITQGFSKFGVFCLLYVQSFF